MQIINIFCLLVLFQFTKTGARDDIDFICSKLGFDGKYLKTALIMCWELTVFFFVLILDGGKQLIIRVFFLYMKIKKILLKQQKLYKLH